jgi:hypothetical protein
MRVNRGELAVCEYSEISGLVRTLRLGHFRLYARKKLKLRNMSTKVSVLGTRYLIYSVHNHINPSLLSHLGESNKC